ncbi:IclR family transcriptional regulator [Vogesella sp. LYT5W]|uniref:IclR family transcriptional regulator n=1 Tax=Vogesella margarita TaxID=2984199 RepID=A0ABT5IK43_9NEIS|nr:IclR family transcriptional regulator [Vogesella margarita]MDC7712581.1 IclR family transcriptional regulator [Vogesella margarita]
MSSTPDTDEEKDRLFVGALARGLRVLAAFQPGEGALSNQVLAQRTDLPKSTVSRLTYTLTKLGYLSQDHDTGYYRLGLAVLALGSTVLGSYDIRRVASPLMREFAMQHTISVSLGMRDGTGIVYLETCRSQARVSVQLTVGSRVPLASTAIGRACYAILSPAERAALQPELAQRYGRDWPVVAARLQASCEHYAQFGYSESFGEFERDVMAVGVALPSPVPGMPVVCLNASGPAFAFNAEAMRRQIAPALIQLARQIVP